MAFNFWTYSQILGQLAPSGAAWATPIITYAFPLNASGMVGTANELQGFSPLDTGTQAKLRIAIQSWDDLISATLIETSGASDIEAAFTTNGVDYAAYGSSLWLNPAFSGDGDNQLVDPPIGNHGYEALLHELGHALGLAHMGNYNSAQDAVPSSYQDSSAYSVMSYFGHHAPAGMPYNVIETEWNDAMGRHAFAQTPMLSDVAAIQSLYGVSTTTRTGNTTYGFHSNVTGPMAAISDFTVNGSPVLTLFDSSGNDTLDLSGWTTTSTISLVSGTFSSCASMVNNIAIAYSCVIENAIGGSGDDVICGNEVANRLEGGAGNDSLIGGAGKDTLIGGAGNDTLNGGDGNDTAIFSGNRDDYTIDRDLTHGTWLITGLNGSIDVVGGIEVLKFDDHSVELAPGSAPGGDTSAPQLMAWSAPYDPAWDNLDEQGNQLVFRFNEPVFAGTGNVVIHNTDGSVATTIDIASGGAYVAGHVVTIRPETLLPYGKDYYITFGDGAFVDADGNAFTHGNGFPDLAFSIQAQPDDYGMTAATAQEVVVGNWNMTRGRIERAGDQDLFKVDVPAGHLWGLSLITFGGATDLYAKVYDANMALIGEQHMTGGSWEAYYYGTGMAPGPYYVAVGSAGQGTGKGYYWVESYLTGDDAPWDPAEAPEIAVNTGPAGFVDVGGDADLFKVNLVAGTEYVFTMSSPAQDRTASSLHLFDSNMTQLSETDLSPEFGGVLYLKPQTSGTFYLGALGAFEGYGTSYYNIRVETSLGKGATFIGTGEAETLFSHDSHDLIYGMGGNDTIMGGIGNDLILGGDGVDTAVLPFAMKDVISASFDTYGHLHVVTASNETTLDEIERVRVDDALIAFDTQVGGSLWQADSLLRAVLGTSPSTSLLSFWVNVADDSTSMSAVGQAMIDLYAPGLQTEALVRLLFDKTLHVAPSDADVNYIVGLVGHGKAFESGGDLFAYVASLPVNAGGVITGSVAQLLDPEYFF